MPDLPVARVQQVLLKMGFQAVLDDGIYLTYFRLDTDLGVCVVTFDVRSPEVGQQQLVAQLDYFAISLTDFWNFYDATSEP